MAQVIFFAHGEHMAKHAEELRKADADFQGMEIHHAHAGNIVALARELITPETEVVLARSTCVYTLRKVNPPVSVIEIPLDEAELMRSIDRAKAVTPEGASIGILGAGEMLTSLEVFTKFVSKNVRLYEMRAPARASAVIARAKADGIATLVSGIQFVEAIRAAGLNAILMDSSSASIAKALNQAREILHARSLEKRRSNETYTILNSISEGIVSFDMTGKPTTVNQRALSILGGGPNPREGGERHALFTPQEQALVNQVIGTGKEEIGRILKRNGRNYAMRIVPVLINGRAEGAVTTIQEVQALQHMEAAVRKGLQQKGNVAQYVFDDIQGGSDSIREVMETARRFARLQSNVLLVGETGTGKELFAQSIHNASDRRDHPFVAVNCGAIPSDLIVSELFGYEDGAFTGAKRGGKIGLFELAHKGTIFLDEISEMSKAGQVNLLRALQERQIRRVGGDTVTPVDVRVIAACNSNLRHMAETGEFRKDLYYRLSVLVVRIPPLRRRAGDVGILARHFLGHYRDVFAKDLRFSESALAELESFSWDGNIRQLRNFCEQVAAIVDAPVVTGALVRGQLRENLLFDEPDSGADSPAAPRVFRDGGAGSVMIKGRPHDKERLGALFRRYRGKRGLLAERLGVCRTTLWKIERRLST